MTQVPVPMTSVLGMMTAMTQVPVPMTSQQVDPRAAHIDKAHEGAEYRQCHFHSTVVSYSVELALLSKMILFSIFWLMVVTRPSVITYVN